MPISISCFVGLSLNLLALGLVLLSILGWRACSCALGSFRMSSPAAIYILELRCIWCMGAFVCGFW